MPEFLSRQDRQPIAYHRTPGARPGVMFLGGFKSDMTGGKALALEHWCRAQGHAFLRFDYQGHGQSGGRFAEGTIGCWRDDALAALDELTEGPQILVGSSMGGWLMLLVALARPDRIAGLLGIACAADFTEDLIRDRLTADLRTVLARDGVFHQPSEYSDEATPITRRLLDEGRNHLLLRGDAIDLHCPVRLLHGMRDADVPWQTSVRVAEQLTGDDVRVVLIKDGEHRLSRESDLCLLTATLEELVERLPPARNRSRP